MLRPLRSLAARASLSALTLLLGFSSPAYAQTFGAIGDSLTDEYWGTSTDITQTDLAARNWVQILAEYRGLDFGAFEGDPTVRGEPRNEGFEYNWARSAATAQAGVFPLLTAAMPQLADANAPAQAAGLVPAIASGDVDFVYVGIGTNDFGICEMLPTYGVPCTIDSAFATDVRDAILGTLDTLQSAGPVDVLLGLLPAGTSAGTDPTTLAYIQWVNAEIAAGAAARGIPAIDLWAWTTDPSRFNEDGNLVFAGYEIVPGTASTLAQTIPAGSAPAGAPCDSAGNCATLAYALNFAAHDGLHPSTIIQGLMANEFLQAMNDSYGTSYALLTEQEILSAAVPEPGSTALVLAAIAALAASRRKSRGAAA